jgi:hypothetical protein
MRQLVFGLFSGTSHSRSGLAVPCRPIVSQRISADAG